MSELQNVNVGRESAFNARKLLSPVAVAASYGQKGKKALCVFQLLDPQLFHGGISIQLLYIFTPFDSSTHTYVNMFSRQQKMG